ncbi:hypothetical protein HW450_08400 [Corynebacterium hindlerae]|uniref:Secreted protein n=1 Tax=Corynebacterium hindlerae TaxID=699041 RepID=A0A7G5FCP8_9CORY|nr:hypothetical protein [Corynebacterium hindlerae]QMV84389.1 hypothetical protein HW450_08400 [Corynebacterium hindlerae]
MPSYRLKPRLQVWKITGLVAALLIIPNAVDPIVPDLDDDRAQVKLGEKASDWEIPLEWPDGGPLVCEKDDDSMYTSWLCEGATVSSIVMDNVIDQKNSLKRGIRAMTISEPKLGSFAYEGNVLLYETKDAIALSQQGVGDQEGKTLVVVVSGEQQDPYTDLVLHNLRGNEDKRPDLNEIGTAA